MREDLPWMKQLVEISIKMEIDLVEGSKIKKEKWKKIINNKINKFMTKYFDEEVKKTKRYKEIIKDNIVPGKQKIYMALSTKIAASVFRARTDIMDPTPRKPYWDNIWKCKYCNEKSQSSNKHYIVECIGTSQNFKDENERNIIWRNITTLEGSEEEIKKMSLITHKIYKQLNKENIE